MATTPPKAKRPAVARWPVVRCLPEILSTPPHGEPVPEVSKYSNHVKLPRFLLKNGKCWCWQGDEITVRMGRSVFIELFECSALTAHQFHREINIFVG
jgi:hypothetical protein